MTHAKYFSTFREILLAYALIVLILLQQRDSIFEHLHLVLDTSNGILSLLLALFLQAQQYHIKNHVRQYLVIAFGAAAFSEILHALVAIEWGGPLLWIQEYSHSLRPTTWPPSTYLLPIALSWLLWLEQRNIILPRKQFATGLIICAIALYVLAWMLPRYLDTGILGIQRPTQIPVLFLLLAVAGQCWRIRSEHPIYEGMTWMCMLLFLSDLFMLYSISPHEKFTMMAHTGKLCAYILLHVIQMKIAAEDSLARNLAENELHIAAAAFEAKEGVFVTDPEGRILRTNKTFTEITGYSAEDAIGNNPRILRSGKHDITFYRSMWHNIITDGSWDGEIWNQRKNGEIFPEHLTITAIKNHSGTVLNFVATFHDISVNKQAEEEIKRLAFYDSLTGLPNRRLLMDRLKQAQNASTRNSKNGALLFIDLDNFKTLNDTLGHDIGDLLLQMVAQRLESCVRAGDTVARLGGDEFVVMLEDLSEQDIEAAEQTEAVGDKILSTLNQSYQLAACQHHNTPSIGATLFSGQPYSAEELLKQADIAMYQAKHAGRNTLRFFDTQMQQIVNARAAMEHQMLGALTLQQFHLLYQVQVDSLNRPQGAEVLIRWQHPEYGQLSPNAFIALAEETGMIVHIGQWVLETACTQLKRWQNDPKRRDLILSINVSAKQFRQTNFAEQVITTVQKHGISPTLLKIELTESMQVDDIEATIATMKKLKDFGIEFSLDDFGTGYSSLQYLKRLPLNQLKIDRSFVSDISENSNDLAIVCTIIAMAQTLKLNVIAEGVESEQQKQLLIANGCSHFQGHLFSKPLPIEKFEDLLKQSQTEASI
jgi:diguanylate cyclase (GGDEF)-like protein/PAS domain S-box-containing protein